MMLHRLIRSLLALAALGFFLSSCGLKRHPYENPITKDTQQPDKVLYDKAIHDIEHSRYEIGRLTLQTMINTYDTSEYLAKAKLAIADSWFREGGAHGLAQAEAEYKDFILFYPTMEEAAEAQEKVCDIHYKQMDKADRDPIHALRAEDECRTLLTQFPNSKYAPQAQQRLRDVQEVLGEGEFQVGLLYHKKGSFPASANRLQGLVDHFTLYSHNDDALWLLADDYKRMGDRFENQEADAYTRIVRDYPLSQYADDATARLQAMNRPVPQADPEAAKRMQYELDNRQKASILSRIVEPFTSHPDVRSAAKTGSPTMAGLRPTLPASVPSTGGATGLTDVNAAVVGDPTALDKNPDARANPPGQNATATPAAAGATTQTAATQQNLPLPTNHVVKVKPKKKKNTKPQATPAGTTTPAPADSTTPAATPAPPQP